MKVLAICTVDLDKNGITTCVMNYFNLIASEEIQMDIVAPNNVSDKIKKTIEKKGMKLYELHMRNSNPFSYFHKLKKIISRGKYDVIHAHGNSCTLAVELLAGRMGGCKRCIAHSHNTTCEHQMAHKLLRPIFEMCCTERIACGEQAGKWLFKGKKFTVVKNGVNLEDYNINDKKRREIRNNINISEEQILIGHIGIFNYQKNHEFLIEIFRKICERKKGVYKLVMIGDGPLREEIEKKVNLYNLTDDVCFTGNVSNVKDYLQAIDVMLLPSRFEGLPYVLIEAQAAGLSCIVSDNVSDEAKLTRFVQFVSLKEIDRWVDVIENEAEQCVNMNREDCINESYYTLTQNGYNLNNSAECLKKIYIN